MLTRKFTCSMITTGIFFLVFMYVVSYHFSNNVIRHSDENIRVSVLNDGKDSISPMWSTVVDSTEVKEDSLSPDWYRSGAGSLRSTADLCRSAVTFYRFANCNKQNKRKRGFFVGSQTQTEIKEEDTMRCATFATFFALLSTGAVHTAGIGWAWKCIDEKCVKQQNPMKCDDIDVAELLDVCRITCGHYGAIWPRPREEVKLSKGVIAVHPDRVTFDLKTIDDENEVKTNNKLMKQMTQQFIKNMKTLCAGNCLLAQKTDLAISISTSSSDTNLTYDTDESYALRVKTESSKIQVSIYAISLFGARHALETLSQLMTSLSKNNTSYLVMVKDATVRDRPLYAHRGLLIDTSRHYLRTSTIKRTLDAMGHSKLNVLHWHATDSHSFPLKLPKVLDLARYGAYSSEKTYSIQEIAEIIDYGKRRGVRVMMEIDSPAHVGNGWQWGPLAGLGELAVCVNELNWREYCIQPPCGQFNPANSNVYELLDLLYRDLLSVFPAGSIFHMGGDEVKFTCWNETIEIVNFMKTNGWDQTEEGFLQLWSMFHRKSLQVLDNIVGHSQTPVILWSSHLTTPNTIEKYLDKERFIIQTWIPTTENAINDDLLAKGYKLIISTKDAWYLDHGIWGTTQYYKWATVYNNRIPPPASGVYGGEGCMWGEYVDDAAIDSRVWPRAAALAERLWTDPESSSKAAQYRFLYHRERLVKMGIAAEAIVPEWCYLNEDQCL